MAPLVLAGGLGFLSRGPSPGAIMPALRLVAALEPQSPYRASNERGALGFRRIRINASCLLRGGERHQSLQGGHHFINMGMSKRICESCGEDFFVPAALLDFLHQRSARRFTVDVDG